MAELLNGSMAAITLAVFVVLAVLNEIGYRIGQGRDRHEPEPSRSVSNTLKGSVIGMVAFVLGFAFSISADRHEQRRQVVLDEANAVGTLHLRAGLLPEPERGELRAALARYVTVRLDSFYHDADRAAAARSQREMTALLNEVWRTVITAKERDYDSAFISEIIPAANQLIDLNTTGGWAFRGHTPLVVLLVLLISVAISAGLIGHSFGQNRLRHPLLCLAFNLLFTLILFVILDYDGSRYGFIRVDHAPLVELGAGIAPPPPAGVPTD